MVAVKTETIFVVNHAIDETSLASIARGVVRSTIGVWMFSSQEGGRSRLRRQLLSKREWFVSFAIHQKKAKTRASALRTWYRAIKAVANGMRVACNVALDQLTLPGVN